MMKGGKYGTIFNKLLETFQGNIFSDVLLNIRIEKLV